MSHDKLIEAFRKAKEKENQAKNVRALAQSELLKAIKEELKETGVNHISEVLDVTTSVSHSFDQDDLVPMVKKSKVLRSIFEIKVTPTKGQLDALKLKDEDLYDEVMEFCTIKDKAPSFKIIDKEK
tara:strand:- start:6215 stop:6592 length:378 start_codon:yes stop_codon:yes gene_type:complete